MCNAFTSCADEPQIRRSPYDMNILRHYSYHTLHVRDNTQESVLFEMPYRLLDPTVLTDTSEKQSYPLVIFLHGRDQQGNDNVKQMTHGFSYFYEQQKKYPCYVAYPQCPTRYYWSYPQRPWPMTSAEMNVPPHPTPMFGAIMQLIDELCANYPIDPDRVVITGFSMGAIGALDIAVRGHDKFAGVVSIAGGINVNRLDALLDMGIWIEHCLDDVNLYPELSLSIIYTFKDKRGADLTAKIYPYGGHTGFHLFESDELMKWIYSHRRNKINSTH